MVTAVNRRTIRRAAPVASRAVITPPDLVIAIPIATKTQQLINLLQRDGGASIAELATMLTWLPHTTRAAMSGLRKKGHIIDKVKEGDTMRYMLRANADA